MKHLSLDQVLRALYKWSTDMLEKGETQRASQTANELEEIFTEIADENEKELDEYRYFLKPTRQQKEEMRRMVEESDMVQEFFSHSAGTKQ